MLVPNFKSSFYRLALSGSLLFLFSACTKELSEKEKMKADVLSRESKSNQADKLNTFYGPQVQMGDGKARSFITISHTGVPIELGIEMNDGALSGFPEDHAEAAFVLPLHHKATDATPFNHIVINWNEHGHPPFELFSEPHFDFHFYTISLSEQMAIPAYSPGSAHDILPQPSYWPAGFVPIPGGVPQMGKHWADILNPVVPGTFTHTMMYGSYNGKLNFVEPMITRAFIASGADVTMPYGQPAVFTETGTYYPTKYNIRDEAGGKHLITLSNFVLR
ncbi:MAG TPA: DUF5602 domain-containing protein [Flavisolibacter sp.]|jgi:hypothetical protein|nr:DUF5602 domain-containing protein [Flavisolibacter sp.]